MSLLVVAWQIGICRDGRGPDSDSTRLAVATRDLRHSITAIAGRSSQFVPSNEARSGTFLMLKVLYNGSVSTSQIIRRLRA